jgi:hypothetical protein
MIWVLEERSSGKVVVARFLVERALRRVFIHRARERPLHRCTFTDVYHLRPLYVLRAGCGGAILTFG